MSDQASASGPGPRVFRFDLGGGARRMWPAQRPPWWFLPVVVVAFGFALVLMFAMLLLALPVVLLIAIARLVRSIPRMVSERFAHARGEDTEGRANVRVLGRGLDRRNGHDQL